MSTKPWAIQIAYPGDVVDEVDAVESAINKINRISGESLGYRIEAIRWDRDFIGGIGVDAQDVINKQVPDYDVLISVIWKRIGSPTGRAQSGTAEEIKSAIARYSKDKSKDRILVYFKNAGVSNLEDIDTDQLAAVNGFRRWLAEQGVLYKSFPDTASLDAFVLTDLAKTCAGLSADQRSQLMQRETEESVVAQIQSEADELGLLDYEDIFSSKMAQSTELMSEVTASIERMGSLTQKRSAEMHILTAAGEPNRTEVRHLIRRTAEDWDDLSSKLERITVELGKSQTESTEALSGAIPLMLQDYADASPRRDLAKILRGLSATAAEAGESTIDYRDTIAGFPRMTVELNKAKKRLSNSLAVLANLIVEHGRVNAKLADALER